MRFVYSRVESIGPDEQDPSSDAIRLYGVPGLANPSMRIAHDQIDSFLAILGFQSEAGLIGCSVRVTVDDVKATEVITFLTKSQPVSAVEPMAFSPYQQPALPMTAAVEPAVAEVVPAMAAVDQAVEPTAVEPAAVEPTAVEQMAAEPMAAEPAVEPESMAAAEPTEATEPVAAISAAATAAVEPPALAVESPVEPVAADVEPAAVISIEPTHGVPVMAAAPPPDEITVYDGVVAPAPLAKPDETCDEPETSILPAEQDLEEKARVELAAAAAAPITERYFLYRETYDQQPRPSVIEVTSGEFAQLGGSGSYLHVDDCSLIGAHDLPPETAQGIERLLERAMSRPEADLPRAELERLAVSGHVVSCAVY